MKILGRKRSLVVVILALSILTVFAGAVVAADPYCYINGQAWTMDQIVTNEAAFKAALDGASNDQILVDVSEDSSGKYLNFGSFVDAVVGGNASLEDPLAFQTQHPAAPATQADFEVIDIF